MKYRRRRGLARRRSGGRPDEAAGGAERRARWSAAADRLRIPEDRGMRLLVSAGAVALLFGVGYLISAAVLFPAQQGPDADSLVEVPELVGLAGDDARSRVEELGLGYAVRGSIAHPEAPEGAVLAQSPLPGQMARPGAPVRVTLSRGAERRAVPEVTGLSERQARIVLERLGFRPAVREVRAMTERGRAVRTRPEAGTELPVPTEVELLVSSGPPVVLVPDLAGRHLDDVASLLEREGLALGRVSFDPLAPEAPGRVTGQYPPAGYSLREGGEVEVRVAGSEPRAGARPAGEPDRL